MIKVKVTGTDVIQSLLIEGHAGYSEAGKDLICAAVSAIGIGLLNALDEISCNDCNLICDDNRIRIEVTEINRDSQLILKTGLIQLKTVEEQFPDYLKIKEV